MTRCVRRRGTPDLRRAFTLVELLCVTLLIAVAATTVALHLSGTTETARLRGARLEIEQALRRARQFAKLRHRSAWLELDPSGRVRAAMAEREGITGVWVPLERLRMIEVAVAYEPAQNEVPTRIRVTASGVTLPWQAILRIGKQAQRLISDGVGECLDYQDLPEGDSP